jgi:RNA polymerase sigma-70 factor (ECF subfamily)
MVTDTEPDTRPTTRCAPRERATDAAIIERSLREPERFAQVFDRYYAEVHGFVARRLGRSLADDVASETFAIAFDRRRRYDLAYPSARPWLYGIAANVIARHRRAEVRQYRALARTGVAPAVDATPSASRGASMPARCARGSPRHSCRSPSATARCCSWWRGRS